MSAGFPGAPASPDKGGPSMLASPRSNLRALLAADVPELRLDAAVADAIPLLQAADAENKLRNRKLYLVLDLDETLVYSSRMADPSAAPVGTQIFVRGQPFDMVTRPGLQHFLQTAARNYVVFLYTMGDEDYTRAILKVIDPENKFFQGPRRRLQNLPFQQIEGPQPEPRRT